LAEGAGAWHRWMGGDCRLYAQSPADPVKDAARCGSRRMRRRRPPGPPSPLSFVCRQSDASLPRRQREARNDSITDGRNMAYEWRREAWRQRLRILAMIVGMAAIFCVVDTLQDGDMLSTMFSRRGWPLLMPVLIYCGGLLVTGLGPRKVGIDCRVLGLLEGDRSVIERYPPLIQACLLRAFKAGAD